MNVPIVTDPRTDPRWCALVNRLPSDVFHSPAWMRVLTDTYGFDFQARLILDDEGEPLGGLPFCHIRDMLGERIVTLPFSDYCDPLTDRRDVWAALTADHLAHDCPVMIRSLHNDLLHGDARFKIVKQAKWHGLDLRPDVDALWRGLHDSSHRAIHKSERSGVVIRAAQNADDLRAFFGMHLAIRKYKYQMLAQPHRLFENIWRHFIEPGAGFLLLACHQDKPIAGVLYLRWKDTLYYKFNASSSASLELRPNDQIMWEGIKRAKESGCVALDFGLSDWDQEGLIRYKRKFGTIEKTISFWRHVPETPRPREEKQTRELLSALTQLFVNPAVPDEVTERAGENLYQYFA